MELVKLTHENIDQERICCAISNNKDIQAMSKKNWLRERSAFLKKNRKIQRRDGVGKRIRMIP